MSRPRLLCLVALPVALAVALAHPHGPVARLTGDPQAAEDELRLLKQEEDQLLARGWDAQARRAARQAVTADVLAGRCDLDQAVRQFAAINGDDQGVWSVLTHRFGSRSVDELTARSVLSHVDARAEEVRDSGVVTRRMHEQFRERYGSWETDTRTP